jgi:hypothetical protein
MEMIIRIRNEEVMVNYPQKIVGHPKFRWVQGMHTTHGFCVGEVYPCGGYEVRSLETGATIICEGMDEGEHPDFSDDNTVWHMIGVIHAAICPSAYLIHGQDIEHYLEALNNDKSIRVASGPTVGAMLWDALENGLARCQAGVMESTKEET